MFIEIIKSKKFLAVFAIVTIVVFVFSFFGPSLKSPIITKTTPQNNAKNVSVIAPIELVLTGTYDIQKITMTSVPETEWNITESTQNTIIGKHTKPLLQNTLYLVNIYWGGESIHKFNFTTENTQTDYELLKKLDDELARDYPLAKIIPYDTPSFRMIYVAPLSFEITVKNPNLTSTEVIGEAKKWVKDNGVDPDKHDYTIAPSVAE